MSFRPLAITRLDSCQRTTANIGIISQNHKFPPHLFRGIAAKREPMPDKMNRAVAREI